MLRMVAWLSAGAEDAGEVSFDQSDAAAFHGNVGAGAHGDADVGLREGGSVVDAVAGHGDDSSLLLQFADDFEFAFGKDFGFEFGDAERAGGAEGDDAVVAGEHHNSEAALLSSRTVSAVVALSWSATVNAPTYSPSTPTQRIVPPG
jgi:hypothetical protein